MGKSSLPQPLVGTERQAQGANLESTFVNLAVGERLEHCPVEGCCYSAGRGHPGLGKAALKAHIDAHLLGILEGQVPTDWMVNKGWVVCPHCGKSASANRMGGVHDSCAARARATQSRNERDEWGHLDDGWEAGG